KKNGRWIFFAGAARDSRDVSGAKAHLLPLQEMFSVPFALWMSSRARGTRAWRSIYTRRQKSTRIHGVMTSVPVDPRTTGGLASCQPSGQTTRADAQHPLVAWHNSENNRQRLPDFSGRRNPTFAKVTGLNQPDAYAQLARR